jgi:hypothetical protein
MSEHLGVVVIEQFAKGIDQRNELCRLGLFNSGLLTLDEVAKGVYSADALAPVGRREIVQNRFELLHNLRVDRFGD